MIDNKEQMVKHNILEVFKKIYKIFYWLNNDKNITIRELNKGSINAFN